MIVYAVYIISKDERTLLTLNFQSIETIPDEQLLGGLFTALQDVTTKVTQSNEELKSIELGGLSYHLRSFGLIRVVLVSNIPKSPENIIQKLGYRFIKDYGDVLKESYMNSSIFVPFKNFISEVIKNEISHGEPDFPKPTKILDTAAIFSLPHHLQSTALTMVSLKEGTIEEIAQDRDETIDDTLSAISSLQEMGYIGIKPRGEKKIYYRVT